MKRKFVVIVVGLLLVGCGKGKKQKKQETSSKPVAGETAGAKKSAAQSTLYFGGKIITMAGAEAGAYSPDEKPQYVEAVVVRDGRILFVGTKDEAVNVAGDNARQVDLAGKTMLPGFIDAHGHLSGVGLQAASANLLPPPDGPNTTIDKLIETTNAWVAQNPDFITKEKWIIGFGYDDSQLDPPAHPTRDDLDRVSTETPVIYIHQSGHMGVLNSPGLAAVGITECGEVPGGVVQCAEDNKTPNGLLLEAPFFAALASVVGGISLDSQLSFVQQGMTLYASNGFTTAQDGRSDEGTVNKLITLANADSLILDVVAYPDIISSSGAIENNATWLSREYRNHFRIGGAKLSLDGSPQGKTAWLTEPYLVPPDGKDKDYVGFPAYDDDTALNAINKALGNNWQLLTHCNGDRAVEQLLTHMSTAVATHGNDDRRSVMIHSQTVRADQLDKMKTLKIIPSFFSMHTFYWGDWHLKSVLGEPRALNISPTGWALKRGMIFTEHHDAPVALPDSRRVLHATVNRITRNPMTAPYVLGEEHRVSPYIALLSITRWAAFQYFEEAHKGTIENGKLADFVILSGNPLEGDPMDIMNLKIIETIKQGESIYRGS